MLLTIHPCNPQQRHIDRVTRELKAGAIIAWPTETGYGLGCDLFNAKAIKKLIALKKRPANKPFSLICADLKEISLYAHVSNTAYRLLRRNLPGPYTFVLPGNKIVPKTMVTRQKTVGIRVASQPISKLLITSLGNPVVNTSIMLSDDDTPLSSAYEVDNALGNRITMVIDGGEIYPEPSSVIDLTSDTPEIIRKGKGDISPFR